MRSTEALLGVQPTLAVDLLEAAYERPAVCAHLATAFHYLEQAKIAYEL